MEYSHEARYYRFLLAEELGIDDKTLDTCGFKVQKDRHGANTVTVTIGMGTGSEEEFQYFGNSANRIMSMVKDVYMAMSLLNMDKEDEKERALEETLWSS